MIEIMSDKKKGYVPIYRTIQDNWIWKSEEPFDHRSAWIDLLLIVNHKEGKICIKEHLQTIRAGQKWTSYRTLAKRWNWSVGRVRRYINLLKSDGMILTDETPNGTLLTVVNWDVFAIQQNTTRHTDGHTDRHTSEHTDGHTDGHITIMNKNGNNVKEWKKEKADSFFEPPTGGGEWQ